MAGMDPHYLWALGHGLMLFGSVYILLQIVFFRATPVKIYKLSYTGALLSYAIVVYKTLGKPQLSQPWIRRAFVDENVQYAVLALYWWATKPIKMSVLPFATFSLFHCLTFVRTNILPKLVPATAQPAGGQPRPPPGALDNLSRQIQLWVKNNYERAMRFVAYSELVIFARVIVGALTFRTSLMAPLFLAHFIRFRYHASAYTRDAVGLVTSRIDGLVAGKGAAVENGWATVKRLVGSWGGLGVQTGPAPGPAAGGAAAAGANAQRRT